MPGHFYTSRWVRPPTETLTEARLPADTPVLADAPGFADDVAVGQRFDLTLWAVRPGQTVTIAPSADGQARTVWFEPLAQVVAVEQERRSRVLWELGRCRAQPAGGAGRGPASQRGRCGRA